MKFVKCFAHIGDFQMLGGDMWNAAIAGPPDWVIMPDFELLYIRMVLLPAVDGDPLVSVDAPAETPYQKLLKQLGYPETINLPNRWQRSQGNTPLHFPMTGVEAGPYIIGSGEERLFVEFYAPEVQIVGLAGRMKGGQFDNDAPIYVDGGFFGGQLLSAGQATDLNNQLIAAIGPAPQVPEGAASDAGQIIYPRIYDK